MVNNFRKQFEQAHPGFNMKRAVWRPDEYEEILVQRMWEAWQKAVEFIFQQKNVDVVAK